MCTALFHAPAAPPSPAPKQGFAAAGLRCKAGLLDAFAGHLLAAAGGPGAPSRLAAARDAYRWAVLAWHLYHEGGSAGLVAADIALDQGAAALGFDWDTFRPLAGEDEQQDGVPACAEAWSMLRFMAAAGPGAVPYPFHMEAGPLSAAWRERTARCERVGRGWRDTL